MKPPLAGLVFPGRRGRVFSSRHYRCFDCGPWRRLGLFSSTRGSTEVWMRVALAAEASDAVSEVFSASPRSAQVASGFLRALASPPEWLLDEALSHKGSVDVVEALLQRVSYLTHRLPLTLG